MSKCEGCGSILSLDKDNIGYTTNLNNKLCERCFRIRNYNEYKSVSKDNSEYYNIIDSINDCLTLLIIDIFDIPSNIQELINHLNNKVILVLSKFDLMPSNYEEKFINYIKDKYNLNLLDSIIISSKKNFHIDELYEMIKKYQMGKVYLVGPTNSGKSSIINKLIYNYSNSDTVITTSNLPSTTLNTIEIKLDNIVLVDTPGILSNDSLINYVDDKLLKRIIPKSKIKPITYQIKTSQTIVIEDIFMIKCQDNDLVFYISNELNIKRYYKNVENKNLIKNNIIVNNNNDIVIPGLGFIKVKKAESLELYLLENTGYYIRNNMI